MQLIPNFQPEYIDTAATSRTCHRALEALREQRPDLYETAVTFLHEIEVAVPRDPDALAIANAQTTEVLLELLTQLAEDQTKQSTDAYTAWRQN